jgi:hypothetical protein
MLLASRVRLMSALGQKRTLDRRPLMSALPPKADITEHGAARSFLFVHSLFQLIADLLEPYVRTAMSSLAPGAPLAPMQPMNLAVNSRMAVAIGL